MTNNTIVGCFDDAAEARAVERELSQAGIPASNIHLLANDSAAPAEEPTVWESVKETFGFADESDRSTYGEAARRGGTLVSVDAPENATPRAIDIMRRHNVVDLDQRSSEWKRQGWMGYRGSAQEQTSRPAVSSSETSPSDASASQMRSRESAQQQHLSEAQRKTSLSSGQHAKEVIPVVQEELRVGKRQVETGGVRIYTHVTEKPVEEKIRLKEEHVNVERRPVDRAVTPGDEAFKERTIEAREMHEQPVINKEARVVEEVEINKGIRERDEKVRDTVRRTDVDVQPATGQPATGQRATGQPATGQRAGAGFSSDAFVNDIAADSRFRGRTFDSMEPDLKRFYEQRYPDGRWEQHREAIRQRLDRMKR
jgi:uncharacterized protein (TIGR02271 family)